jgi:FkbM family methyltransferase
MEIKVDAVIPEGHFPAWIERLSEAGLFFLQIGAMDGVSYDPLHPLIEKYRWNGLLVEPLPDHFEKLKSNYAHRSGLAFENCAIAGHDGEMVLHRIPLDVIKEHKLPHELQGVSSAYMDRGVLSGGGEYSGAAFDMHIKPRIVQQGVACMTLDSLLKKHDVKAIDMMLIDTEGADAAILAQLDLTQYRPKAVIIEFKHLPQPELDGAVKKMHDAGYFTYISIDEQNLLFTETRLH